MAAAEDRMTPTLTQIPLENGETTALVYAAERADAPRLVFGHGAGAGQRSAFIVRWAEELRRRGITVVTFDFPYVARGKKLPDRPPQLEACFRAVLARQGGESPRPFIGGKSMGGRMATHLAAAGDPIAGVVVCGYPLHPPDKPAQLRVEHLPRIACPMLIFQGERDEFGSPAELAPYFAALQHTTIRAVPTADHSLAVRPASQQAAVDATLLDEAAAFILRSRG